MMTLRRIAAGLCLVALLAIPASARIVIFGAVPSWVKAGAKLDVDFANGRYFGCSPASCLSVTRASSGYVSNADGSLTLIGNNTARIGGGTGLLIEEARTNLILQSQTFGNASWIKTNSTATDNQSVAPDGTTTADTFSGTAAGTTTYAVSESIVATSATQVSYSLYVAPGTTSFVALAIGQNAGNFATAVFDLTNVSATSASQTSVGGTSGTITSTSQTKVSGGYFRVSIVAAISVANPFMNIEQAAAATGNTFSANGDVNNAPQSKSLTIWGAQAEAAAFPLSYIPTVGSTVARAADNITAVGSLAAILTSSGGSVAAITQTVTPSTPNAIMLGRASGTNATPLYYQSSQLASYSGSITLADGTAGSLTSLNKSALGWSAAGRSLVLNNGTVSTDGNALAAAPSYFVGNELNAKYLDGYISRLTIWSNRLPDTALKAMTQ